MKTQKLMRRLAFASALLLAVGAGCGADDDAPRFDGTGGIICVDRTGELGAAHNTGSMVWGAGRGGAVGLVVDITIGRKAAILGV